MLNQVVLVGRLTKDPEYQDKNGKKLCYVTLAVQRPYRNADNLYDTDFIHCVLWNAIAENTCEYCKCGDIIGVKGRLQSGSYETEDGDNKYYLEVVAERITFLSSKSSLDPISIDSKE